MANGLLDFLTADYATRQQRTRDLNDRLGGLLDYYLGPTGIPDRLRSLNALLNPIDQIGEAGANTVVAFDPTRPRQDRIEAALNAGLGTITAAAPAVAGAIAGQPARRALMETLVGASDQVDDAAARLAADIQARGGALAADATGLGRGLLARDPEMIGEVFQPSGMARGLSADAPAGIVTPYADVEVIDPRDIIGAKISPTPADLTRAGSYYEGIDAAGTTRRTPLLGGPLFPLQQAYSDADVAWLVNSLSKGSTKLGKDSDFLAVTAMAPRAHQSNASINDAFLGTLEAYVNSGRISPDVLPVINEKVREFGASTVDPDLQILKNFIGFGDPNFDEYMRDLTFDQRAAIAKKMQTPEMQNYGVPNMQRILDATIQPEFAGSNLGDTLLLLELDKNRGLLNLAAEGLPEHMSYNTGIPGRVVGRFQNPVSRGLLFSDFESEYAARPTMLNKSGGVDEARMAYSFGRALPVETMTPEKARNINEAIQYSQISQPRQAQLIEQAVGGQWRSSTTPKTQGGIAPVEYERALRRNPSLPSLEPYTARDVMQGAKAGDFEVFQLGDADVYFGLKRNPDYSWMNNGSPIPELGPNEVDLVGVISNEIGAKGVASPAILGKAIEQGATVLNAFAVPSARHPKGFLPDVYGSYGFDEIRRIPFSKEFYIAERGEDAYADLLRQWRSEGWDESQGFPDVVLMKWRGTDAERSGAAQRVFEESFAGFGEGAAPDVVAAAGGTPQSSLRSTSGSQAVGPDNGRGDTGPIRDDRGSRQPSGIRGAAAEVMGLSPLQRRNLGLLSGGL